MNRSDTLATVERWLPQLTEKQANEVAKYLELSRARPEYFKANCGVPYVKKIAHGYGKRYLEIGYGDGSTFEIMNKKNWQTWGADVIPERGTHPNTVVAPAWDLPFRDNFFDCVGAWDVLEHILEADIWPTLQEIQRVLMPGGLAYLRPAFSSAYHKSMLDEQLHVTVKPQEWWHARMKRHFETVEFEGAHFKCQL